MFASLIRRAQVTVDNVVGQALNRVFIAIPFLLAGGFATAAASLRLTNEFGPETSNLILAGVFVAIGLVTALVLKTPAASPAAKEELPAALNEAPEASADPISQVDRDLLMAALSSAAPVALPGLIRVILKNLPLVIAIVAALFVMTRKPQEDMADQTQQAAA